jgi:hypothetical protein
MNYIRDNFRPDDRLAVVLVNKQKGDVVQRIASADKIAGEEFQRWLRHMNAQKYEVYVTWNRTGRISLLLTPVGVRVQGPVADIFPLGGLHG